MIGGKYKPSVYISACKLLEEWHYFSAQRQSSWHGRSCLPRWNAYKLWTFNLCVLSLLHTLGSEHREENLKLCVLEHEADLSLSIQNLPIYFKRFGLLLCHASGLDRRGKVDQIPGKDLNQGGSAAGRPQGSPGKGTPALRAGPRGHQINSEQPGKAKTGSRAGTKSTEADAKSKGPSEDQSTGQI